MNIPYSSIPENADENSSENISRCVFRGEKVTFGALSSLSRTKSKSRSAFRFEITRRISSLESVLAFVSMYMV